VNDKTAQPALAYATATLMSGPSARRIAYSYFAGVAGGGILANVAYRHLINPVPTDDGFLILTYGLIFFVPFSLFALSISMFIWLRFRPRTAPAGVVAAVVCGALYGTIPALGFTLSYLAVYPSMASLVLWGCVFGIPALLPYVVLRKA
jgi:hypothetical protein